MSKGKVGRETVLRLRSRRPLPQVARRLRTAFPDLWVRYRLLESSRDFDGVQPPAPDVRERPVRPS